MTFDERGYIGSAPELRWPVVALSLGGLRRKIEIAMLPDESCRCPLPPSADIGPGGQSVGQAAQFCLAAPTPAADGAAPKEEVRVWTPFRTLGGSVLGPLFLAAPL